MECQSQPSSDSFSDRSEARIDHLIVTLHSKNGLEREDARRALVNIGQSSVPRLIPLMQDLQELVRWEACKALMDIGDPSCVPVLIDALDDESSDVRWVAAEALMAFGQSVLALLAQALIARPHAIYLREGAHHILDAQQDPAIKAVVEPLLKALNGLATRDTICLVAERTLKQLR